MVAVMKNKKYYPFSRNNYYYSKLLTVRDFESEQRYLNDKRRVSNYFTHGAGVLSGLSLIVVDDKTVSVEAGIAYDYLGREIVVDTSFSKRLSVIEGFDTIVNTDAVYLALAYDEKLDEPAHAITLTEPGEQNYNKIKETFRIFVTDTVVNEDKLTLSYLLEDARVIHGGGGVKITQIVPCYANMRDKLWIKVKIEKTNVPRLLDVDYTLNLQGFTTLDGQSSLQIRYTDDDISAYSEKTISLSVMPAEGKNMPGKITVGGGKITIGTESIRLTGEGMDFTVKLTDESIHEHIIEKYNAVHFDELADSNAECPIYLAKLRLIKKGSDYSIEHAENLPFKQRVISNAMIYALAGFNYERARHYIDVPRDMAPSFIMPPVRADDGGFASGDEIIELESRSANRSFFSDEIAHGLGKGDVLIHAGIEDYMENSLFEQQKTVFGNADIFANTEHETNIASFDIGILSYTDKGTFKIGVRPKADLSRFAVTVKWWAYKARTSRAQNETELVNVTISLEPNTVTLTPRERLKFTVQINGTDDKECHFLVNERDGGVIDRTGVYEAPNREGVYEVIAESVKYPSKKATAYVIVKNR